MMVTAITVAMAAEKRKWLSIEKALSFSTESPMYQLTEESPLIGVNVTIRVLPSTLTSLKSLLMRGVSFG
ncbi:hypothetical protein D3C71_644600 [compost metagenome]